MRASSSSQHRGKSNGKVSTGDRSIEAASELGDFLASPRLIFIALLAVGIGALSAFVALALLKLIGIFTNLFFFQRWGTTLVSPADNTLGPWVIVVPILGGLIIGLMARYGSDRIRGHGIPEAIEAILMNGSRVEAKVALLKPISAAISIGSGGPFGAEGPIIMTGGAFGSLTAQFFHLTSAVPQRWKKKRLVKRPISFSRARATTALRAPMTMAIRAMKIRRGEAVKSPSCPAATTASRRPGCVAVSPCAAGPCCVRAMIPLLFALCRSLPGRCHPVRPRRPLARRRVSARGVGPPGGQEEVEGRHQGRAGGAQFRAVVEREVAEFRLARGGEVDQDAAAVGVVPPAPEQPQAFEAVDQFDGAVVLQEEPLGQGADRGRDRRRETFQRQEELVLLRLQASRARGLLAEMEEAPEAIAHLGQRAVLIGGQGLVRVHRLPKG